MLTPSRAAERRDLGQHARPVGHRDAQLDQRAVDRGDAGGRLRRATAPARGPGASRSRVARDYERAHAVERRAGSRRARRRSRRGSRRRCRARCRDGRRRSGSCPGTRRPRAAGGSRARSPRRVGDVHQRRRGELRARGSRPRPARRAARASTSIDLGAEPADDAAHGGEARAGRCARVGVSTQVAPANRSASAPSRPSCSEPAIGWPPTKPAASSGRAGSTSATTGAFTEPTSVTTAAPGVERLDDQPRRPRRPATATITTSAPCTASSDALGRPRRPRPSSSAPGAAPGRRRSRGHVPAPRRRARPIEPPIRPVPIDRGLGGHYSRSLAGRSSRSVARPRGRRGGARRGRARCRGA